MKKINIDKLKNNWLGKEGSTDPSEILGLFQNLFAKHGKTIITNLKSKGQESYYAFFLNQCDVELLSKSSDVKSKVTLDLGSMTLHSADGYSELDMDRFSIILDQMISDCRAGDIQIAKVGS